MFGIGTGELLLLLIIALIVLGPERMPKLARDLGKTMNDLRRTSDELKSEFLNADRTLNAEKLLDVATNVADRAAALPGAAATPSEPAPAPTGATPPPAQTTESEESASDREARLARERLADPERAKRAEAEGLTIPTDRDW